MFNFLEVQTSGSFLCNTAMKPYPENVGIAVWSFLLSRKQAE